MVPLKETPFVKAGKHRPDPRARHLGLRRFRRQAWSVEVRCPSGECSPASVWIKADRLHTLIPRETARWKKLYRGRSGVEREFGRLKHEWAMLPFGCGGSSGFHVDLTILSRLAVALAKARAVPLAA